MPPAMGYEIARLKEIPWEDRVNVDGWPSRAGMYWDDRDNQLCTRLIDYPSAPSSRATCTPARTPTTVFKGQRHRGRADARAARRDPGA